MCTLTCKLPCGTICHCLHIYCNIIITSWKPALPSLTRGNGNQYNVQGSRGLEGAWWADESPSPHSSVLGLSTRTYLAGWSPEEAKARMRGPMSELASSQLHSLAQLTHSFPLLSFSLAVPSPVGSQGSPGASLP